MEANTMGMKPETSNDHTRQARLDAIRDAATVRAALGQVAGYERLADGSHQVTLRGRHYTGVTVADAIQQARTGRS